MCRVLQTKKEKEGAILYYAKGGIFFRLFLSNESGTAEA
jgi:hypothetical protein